MTSKSQRRVSDKAKIKLLRRALKAAEAHLEYCGYGDTWERAVATDTKLPEFIARALEETGGVA